MFQSRVWKKLINYRLNFLVIFVPCSVLFKSEHAIKREATCRRPLGASVAATRRANALCLPVTCAQVVHSKSFVVCFTEVDRLEAVKQTSQVVSLLGVVSAPEIFFYLPD